MNPPQTAADYAQSRMQGLEKLYQSEGFFELSAISRVWPNTLGEKWPGDCTRIATVNFKDGSRFQEYPDNRVLFFDHEGKASIWGIRPKPPVDWSVVGPQCAEALRITAIEINNYGGPLNGIQTKQVNEALKAAGM